MKEPNLKAMNENIFLAIEQYLATPSKALAAQIKTLSHSLANDAYEAAKPEILKKAIEKEIKKSVDGDIGSAIDRGIRKAKDQGVGGDDWQPLLLERIKALAKEASSYSARLISNNEVGEHDPEYIFRLSEPQKKQINDLIGDLLKQKSNSALHPDGLIFAYAGYMERRRNSKFKYCEGIEASAYDHNALLYLKAKNLAERGHGPAAAVLSEACSEIKNQLQSSSPKPEKYKQITAILEQVKNVPEVQAHRGEVKTLIVNFLLMISLVGAVYLAATVDKRGSFWYRPHTDSENKIENFEDDLSQSFIKKDSSNVNRP